MTWLIEFYAAWSPQCAQFAPTFSEMSSKYVFFTPLGTVRHCQSEEASIVWSHHEETRELPGERNNARNNAMCTQARKTTHGLDRQHQVMDRTLCGRVNQNDRG